MMPPKGPYDPDPTSEEDLWFLPGPVEAGTSDPWAPPLPMAGAARLPRVADWVRGQGDLAADLAQAAMAFGALDARARQMGRGLVQRLVLTEVADLSWHLGERISADRLALYLSGRLAGTGDAARALYGASWAVRRLRNGGSPLEDLGAFLGRCSGAKIGSDIEGFGWMSAPQGEEFQALAGAWAQRLSQAGALHPFAQAAFGWMLWSMLELSGDELGIEAAVSAACLAARAGRGGLGFVPLAMGGGMALRQSGEAPVRLAAWLSDVERACLRGLMLADQLADWQQRALRQTAHLSGRTPPLLIDVLLGWPMVPSSLAERETGASRATILRNLERFEGLGLIRERTGQGRYRFWEVAL
mgnify:CR=1 FL=1